MTSTPVAPSRHRDESGSLFTRINGVRQPSPGPHDHDILTTAEGSRRLGVFVDYMRAAGLAGLLLGPGPFTVLAPTERAFEKFSLRERDALLADPRRLTRVMRGHILAGHVVPPMMGEALSANTIDGETRLLLSIDGTTRVDSVRIIQANVRASNGLIHAIESLLL